MPIKHNETQITDKNTKMPPSPNTFLFFVHTPTSKFQMQFYPPPRQFYIDGVLPPGDTFFWNSPNPNPTSGTLRVKMYYLTSSYFLYKTYSIC